MAQWPRSDGMDYSRVMVVADGGGILGSEAGGA